MPHSFEHLGITIQQTRKVTKGTIYQYNNGVIFFVPDEGVHTLKFDEVKEHYQAYLEITNNKPCPFLSDNTELKGMGIKEKQYIQSNFHHFASHAAMLVKSSLSKFVVNTFLFITPPKLPVKLFTNKEQAMKWLISVNNNRK